MTAFNRIGPVWAGANYDLLTEVLRNEWGFLGSVVMDWSSGDEIMNVNRGVLAGNDMWLNPMKNNGTPLDRNNPTEMYCGREAVRHNVYTFISTYQARRDYDAQDDEYKTSIIQKKEDTFNWWIPSLISMDVLVFAATAVFTVLAFVPMKRKQEKS